MPFNILREIWYQGIQFNNAINKKHGRGLLLLMIALFSV